MQISVFTSDTPLSKTFRRGPNGMEKLAGERNISLRMARKLEAASISVLGLRRAIPAACWLGLEEHPALERKEGSA